MATVATFDGSYYLHRAFSVSGQNRDIATLEKSTVTLFLSMICKDILEHYCTHAIVCFDGPQTFRKAIYPQYKANRQHGDGTIFTKHDGTEVKTELTTGSMVKPAKAVLKLAGITYTHRKMYEADDLMNCVASSLGDDNDVIIFTRDKDLAQAVRERVRLFWPREKKFLGVDEVKKHFGVSPKRVLDYLCLIGDAVDNVPGLDGWGPDRAVKFITKYGSIGKALKTPEGEAKIGKYRGKLTLARKLITLRDDIEYNLEDLVIDEFDEELAEHVWKIPESLHLLGDTRKAAKIKGLFGRK